MPFRDAVGRTFAFLLLPLSLLPIYLALPRLKAEFGSPQKQMDRSPLPPPKIRLSMDEVRRFRQLPLYRGAIPVLAYHGINAHNDVYSVSQRMFAAQIEMLYRAGFRTVSIGQYVRFLRGDRKGLPPRPLLITFDDGRLDSYRGADKVLAHFGYRATMFVIAGAAAKPGSFYLSWQELRAMSHSGRWDIQERAGARHDNIQYARGRWGPFYAFRIRTSNGRESFGRYAERVRSDILWGERMLEKHLPRYRPLAFSVPFGNYGQLETNDRRIPNFLSHFLRSRFTAVFTLKPVEYTTVRTRRYQIGRYEVHTYTTAARLYNWLRERLPDATGGLRIPPLWCRPGWVCRPKDPTALGVVSLGQAQTATTPAPGTTTPVAQSGTPAAPTSAPASATATPPPAPAPTIYSGRGATGSNAR
jgi:peptidoglycan/xylan/chitin deacetylase (PgdA/CDA1 family)